MENSVGLELSKKNIGDVLNDVLGTTQNYGKENNNYKFSFEFISNDIEDTNYLGKELSKYLDENTIIALNGELGSGKTALITSVISNIDNRVEVSSPTFTIVNEYNTKGFNIFHFDVYRLKSSEDFVNTIGDEYFFNGLCIIEWADIISDILPESTIHIDISKVNDDENKRIFKIWRGI